MSNEIISKSNSFLIDLRSEIRMLQESRSKYIRQKFIFVISLLGLGSVSIANIKTSTLLFIVPLISLAFDLYIIGEDFGIKRAGGFLKSKDSDSPENEKKWEKYVKENRDPFSFSAKPLLSALVLFVSSAFLYSSYKNYLFFWAWLILNVIILFSLQFYSKYLNSKVQNVQGDS